MDLWRIPEQREPRMEVGLQTECSLEIVHFPQGSVRCRVGADKGHAVGGSLGRR